jgi:putative transposase
MSRFSIVAHTFSSLYVHCIFSTKERVPVLGAEIRERLWPYLGGIAKQHSIRPVCVGGMADHVHMLLSLPTTIAVAKAIQSIKGASSAWVHDTFRELNNFAWQEGYGAFSVSVSHLPETIGYIQNQAEHHRTRTFREEYLAILKKHNLQFEDKYVWN